MDPGAQDALAQFCRTALRHELAELDRLAGAVAELQRRREGDLHARLCAVEAAVGLSPAPAGQTGRRDRVAELAGLGLSDRLIARIAGADRATIARDRAALGLPHAGPDAVGRDGYRLGERSANGSRNGHGRANGSGCDA